MDRLEAFEKMLSDLQTQFDGEKLTMEQLKSQGKEKSATYRQYMGNRLVYARLFELYRQYGLVE